MLMGLLSVIIQGVSLKLESVDKYLVENIFKECLIIGEKIWLFLIF